MSSLHSLTAISPLDGRYAEKLQELTLFVSEYGLIRYRLRFEVEYLRELAAHPYIPLRPFTAKEHQLLGSICVFPVEEAQVVKELEKVTNHDVKAVELYLAQKFAETSLADVIPWIHICLTSEDTNNFAYALMLRDVLYALVIPQIEEIYEELSRLAVAHAGLAMLARTHGQPATPTTLGKEYRVFASRLQQQYAQLKKYRLGVKLNGASGNYNAFVAAFPDVDWEAFSEMMAKHFQHDAYKDMPPFRVNMHTTQIEPHDTYAELFDILRRINTILIDFSQDMWRYISDDWIVQKPKAGEVGSSTMPHKVNPIDFENAEGNLAFANSILEFFSRKLPISRLQRDLSDSTVERNFGVPIGHSLVGYLSLLKGLSKVSPDAERIVTALEAHPEVVTEAYQTILRREGIPDAYDRLKAISRGKKLTSALLASFVRALPVPLDVKREMLAITPKNYIGRAVHLAKNFPKED